MVGDGFMCAATTGTKLTSAAGTGAQKLSIIIGGPGANSRSRQVARGPRPHPAGMRTAGTRRRRALTMSATGTGIRERMRWKGVMRVSALRLSMH